jgi:hypothetical protein
VIRDREAKIADKPMEPDRGSVMILYCWSKEITSALRGVG